MNNKSIIGRYQRWNSYRRTVRELNQLSDRELADLGIHRPDIRRVARSATQL